MTSARPLAESVTLPAARTNAVALVLFAFATVLGAVSGSAWSADPRRFAFSYLVALVFVTSVSVGTLAWLLILHLTGAVWSVSLRRLLENLTRPLPWIALLFIPVVMNLGRLYVWADPARVSADQELARKAIWLNPTAFTVRTAFYLATWAIVAGLLTRSSALQDRAGDPAQTRRMRATSTWGTIALGLTSSFAATDWLMSLDPHWTSTIFGVYFWAGALVSALAALILLVLALHAAGWLRQTITVEHLHDLGKLLLGFVIFWAYIAFSQYFLIWYANFPEETRWYVIRRTGDWNTLSWALVFGHFVVPFFLLLPRATKRSQFWLGFVAAWVLVFHYADLYWLIMPALHSERPEPHWLDASLLLALVFLCGAIVARACQARPLVPVGDPRLCESIAFRNS
jgi:hypothetical protein